MGRPRKFDADAVLTVALRHFWSSGYAAAKIDDICRDAGITKPSLYNAFGDKDALYTAALGHYEKTFQTRVLQALNSANTAEEAIEQYFSQTAAILSDPTFPKGCLRVKTLSECATSHPKLVKVAHTQREASICALVEMLSHYEYSGARTKEIAEFMVVLSDGLAASAPVSLPSQMKRNASLAAQAAQGFLAPNESER